MSIQILIEIPMLKKKNYEFVISKLLSSLELQMYHWLEKNTAYYNVYSIS